MSGHSDLGIFINFGAFFIFNLGISRYCVSCLSCATWQFGDDIHDFGIFVEWREVRMPRRGWQAIEVPSGWYEVIRGPRPQAQKWPFAPSRQLAQHSRQPAQQSRQSQSGPASRQGGRWGPRRGVGSVGRQEPHQSQRLRASPEVVLSSARERVVKLEAALAALGDVGGPEVILLQSSLKSAK